MDICHRNTSIEENRSCRLCYPEIGEVQKKKKKYTHFCLHPFTNIYSSNCFICVLHVSQQDNICLSTSPQSCTEANKSGGDACCSSPLWYYCQRLQRHTHLYHPVMCLSIPSTAIYTINGCMTCDTGELWCLKTGRRLISPLWHQNVSQGNI